MNSSKKILAISQIIFFLALVTNVLALQRERDGENKRTRYLYLAISQPNIDNCYTSSIPINETREVALTLFPNPNNGFFKIEISNLNPLEDVKIQIFNLDGSMVAYHSIKYRDNDSVMFGRMSFEFDLSKLPKGIYVVHTRVEEKIHTHKLIII